MQQVFQLFKECGGNFDQLILPMYYPSPLKQRNIKTTVTPQKIEQQQVKTPQPIDHDAISKLHGLLKEKNNVILQWSNRYMQLEKKYQTDLNSLREQYERSYQIQIEKRTEQFVDKLKKELEKKDEYIEELETKVGETDEIITQVKKSYEVRALQSEKENNNLTRQIENLHVILSQQREQTIAFEQDRNNWVQLYEQAMSKGHFDSNKEKLIELRTMNQVLEEKCKELRDDKDRLSRQVNDLQALSKSGSSSHVERLDLQLQMLEKQIKEKDHRISQITKELDHANHESQKLRNDLSDSQEKLIKEVQAIRTKYESELKEVQSLLEKANREIQVLEQRILEEKMQFMKETQRQEETYKEKLQTIENTRYTLQNQRYREEQHFEKLTFEKQLLEQELQQQKQRILEQEIKLRLLESENEKLIQIKSDKQKEIDIWIRKANEIQNECSLRIEELARQLNNSAPHPKEALEEDQIEFLNQQILMAQQELQTWKQRAQMNEDTSKYSEELNFLRQNLRQQEQEIAQLQKELYKATQLYHEAVTENKIWHDQYQSMKEKFTKLEQQQVRAGLKESHDDEFSFQGEEGEEDIYFQESSRPQKNVSDITEFDIDRRQNFTMQSESD